MSQQVLLDALPENHRKHLDPSSPEPVRMMAAKGIIPAPPRDMVVILCGLSIDADEKIAGSAWESLAKLPDKVVGPAIEGDLPAIALGLLAQLFEQNEVLQEKLVLNRNTPDEAIAQIAPHAAERVAEIIAQNQERCLRSEAIVRGIAQNTNILKSSLDRLFDFLTRSGILYEDMGEFAEAMGRLTPTELVEMADNVELPEEAEKFFAKEGEVQTKPQSALEKAAALRAQKEAEESGEEEAQRIPVAKLINNMSTAQKVAFALKGNKEARSILMRDANKMVCTAAIKSPRITESEVVAAAQNKSIHDDVIRIITKSKEMTRSYSVKLALVGNPKTPLQISMKYLPLLRNSDLRATARSRHVPAALAKMAKMMVRKKSGG